MLIISRFQRQRRVYPNLTQTDYQDGDTVAVLEIQMVVWSLGLMTSLQEPVNMSSLDSVIYAYLEKAGDYTVTVEDYHNRSQTGEDLDPAI